MAKLSTLQQAIVGVGVMNPKLNGLLTRGLLKESRSQDGYKNVGVLAQAPSTSEESFNSTESDKNPKQSLTIPMSTKHQIGGRMPTKKRVPIMSKDGKPLTPCSMAKARRLLKGGVAKKKWNKLGIFYIQLLVDTRKETPKMCIGLDTGSKFDGYAVVSKREVQQTGMAILPKLVCKKLEGRRIMRHLRRYRNTWRRQKRNDNKIKKIGWIAPSQKSKVDFRLRIISELKKIYPIWEYAIEDVSFNHYKKHWGTFFSTTEIGKNQVYTTLSSFGEIKKYKGFETASLRDRFGLTKTRKKEELIPESHAIDAMVIAMDMVGCVNSTIPSFYVWKRYELYRRQLHKKQPQKGSVRQKFGGSVLNNWLKKGDFVCGIKKDEEVFGWVCSNSNGSIGIATFDDGRKWRISEDNIIKYYSNLIQYKEVMINNKKDGGFFG